MCFYVSSRKKTATKDIIVYKILLDGNVSPFEYYKYNYKLQPKVQFGITKYHCGKVIGKGYHFYKNYGIAVKARDITYGFVDAVIKPFLIPKGTKYYENKKEIVAETCKMLTKKEAKQWT